jgi:hypothetical protein
MIFFIVFVNGKINLLFGIFFLSSVLYNLIDLIFIFIYVILYTKKTLINKINQLLILELENFIFIIKSLFIKLIIIKKINNNVTKSKETS